MTGLQSIRLGAARHAQPAQLWQLSNHFLRRHFPHTELWADEAGEAWAGELGLRYDSVRRLPPVPDGLGEVWSLGKLQAAAAQAGPFLHVDGDAFWRCAPPAAAFLVQHDEGPGVAGEWWRRAGFGPVPMPSDPRMFNFGIFGGTAWREIAAACAAAIACAEKHAAMLAGCRCGLAMLVEQVWVPALVEAAGVPVTCLLPSALPDRDEAARALGYFHAAERKKDPATMAQVAARWAEVNAATRARSRPAGNRK